jgi:hypothetical protein
VRARALARSLGRRADWAQALQSLGRARRQTAVRWFMPSDGDTLETDASCTLADIDWKVIIVPRPSSASRPLARARVRSTATRTRTMEPSRVGSVSMRARGARLSRWLKARAGSKLNGKEYLSIHRRAHSGEIHPQSVQVEGRATSRAIVTRPGGKC